MVKQLYNLIASQDGLWLELNGERYRSCINIEFKNDFCGKAAKEVWQILYNQRQQIQKSDYIKLWTTKNNDKL